MGLHALNPAQGLLILETLVAATLAIQVPTASYVAPLGLATDAQFDGRTRRDGGGGGYVNGYHLVGFCDSTTATLNQELGLDAVTSFAHNTFAYIGYSNETNPTVLYNFGDMAAAADTGTFSNLFGAQGNETSNPSFAIWASGNYVPSSDDKQAIGVMNCLNENSGTALTPANQVYYNTLVAINVTDPRDSANPRDLTGSRIVERLFYDTENLYGSFTLYKGSDNFLYLIGTSKSPTHGLTAARVSSSSLTDRSKYTYWDGSSWSTTQPSITSQQANIFNFTNPSNGQGPNTGEIFYSAYHDTLLAVFMDSGIDGTFWYSYVEHGGDITGPWAPAQQLWTSPLPSTSACPTETWNYDGHAYPDWDPSGRTLLLSWSSCQSWIDMATVVWK